MKWLPYLIIVANLIFLPVAHAQVKPVAIAVDITQQTTPLKPIWAWFGYDEPNYTYMKDGKKLLTELAALSPVPVYVRTHNLMTSGDGTAALKWGSTNMYSEDKNGNPIYDWTIADKIFDTYIERGMKPLAQIGFMPAALSEKQQPYQHNWNPTKRPQEIVAGWAYPPKDYNKWADLISAWVKHCVERYGKAEVETWYWELWNEADGFYLVAPDKEQTYFKMYDYAAFAVKRALPTARMGGPHTAEGRTFFRNFLKHVLHGKNFVTGGTGSPLDFVAFHAKGQPTVIDGRVHMSMSRHFINISDGFASIAAFPELKNIPVIIGESDPEGCAACGVQTNPENAYRNGTLYASYTAASIAREYDLAQEFGVNLLAAVNWSFEFENQPWFAGYRDLATNGVNKPVLNAFKMFGMMQGNRVAVSGDLAYNAQKIRSDSVRGERTDISALATADKKSISVLVWNYHDEDIIDDGSPVELTIKGIEAKELKLTHYRIDSEHSNSYTAWKKMGSPQQPTAEQVTALERASALTTLDVPKKVSVKNREAKINMQLPRQGISLVKLTY